MYIFGKLFYILFLSFCCLHIRAQTRDSAANQNVKKQKTDTTKKPWKYSGTRLGLDLIGLAQFVYADKKSVHLNSDIGFNNKHLFVWEYTWASSNIEQQATYQSQGSLVRVGWMHNFLHKQSKDDVFALGMRLGNAWYTESVRAQTASGIFGSSEISLKNNLRATWIELNMELKARVWKNWMTGYSLRYQFKSSPRGEEQFVSYQIPSVGRVGKNNWGFQYCIWYFLEPKKKKNPKV
jgi:hypothetical protein